MRPTRSRRGENPAIHNNLESADVAANTPLPLTPAKERAPLGEVTGNNYIVKEEAEVDMATKPAAKGKGKGKGGRKGKKGKKAAEEEPKQKAVAVDETEQPEVLEDERMAAGSPASDAAREELNGEHNNDIVQVPMLDQPVSPPSRAVRMTRRQLAKQEEELSRPQMQAPKPEKPAEPQPLVMEVAVQEDNAPELAAQFDTPDVTVTPGAEEPKSLAAEKPNDEDSFGGQATSRSPIRTPMSLENSFEAIDALEERIEEVGKAITQFESDEGEGEKLPKMKTSPAKSAKAKSSAQTPKIATKPTATIAASAAKVSRNPNDPKSLKENNSSAKCATRSTTLSRSTSQRMASKKIDVADKAKTEVTDYLASKRRPISLSFPTPAPPQRSSKPPTKPTFQLPGEAITAKLKAQREERFKREEEEVAKKKEFKARPAPNPKASASVAVKQTAASKARESLMHGGSSDGSEKEDKTEGKGPTTLPLKRTRSINATNGKRQSTITATAKRSSSLLNTSRPASTASNDRVKKDSFTTSSAPTPKRLSIAVAPTPVTKSTVTAADAAAQRLKAREIFNRDKVEKEQREKERREKEEAAKKARAEAAERGRQASREWAERQKLKKMQATLPKAVEGEAATAIATESS